jgi:hemoglobin
MMGYLKSFGYSILAGAALVTLGACAQQSGTGSSRPEAIASTTSLYDRLGGKPAITAVVDQFVANVAADSRINARFATTDIPKLKGHLVDQLCGATGGPCTYTGRSMKTIHAGMRITNDEFNALVQDLVAALDKFNVPLKEKSDLLALLSPMKQDIVEMP